MGSLRVAADGRATRGLPLGGLARSGVRAYGLRIPVHDGCFGVLEVSLDDPAEAEVRGIAIVLGVRDRRRDTHPPDGPSVLILAFILIAILG